MVTLVMNKQTPESKILIKQGIHTHRYSKNPKSLAGVQSQRAYIHSQKTEIRDPEPENRI